MAIDRSALVRRSAAALSLGVLTTVAVAWFLSAQGEDTFHQRERFWMKMVGDEKLYVVENFSPGRTARWATSSSVGPDTSPADRDETLRQWRSIVQTTREAGNVPSWPSWGTLPVAGNPASWQYSAGWPCRCLWYEWTGYRWLTGASDLHGGIDISSSQPSTNANGPAPRVLPYRPVWIGLAVNAAAYGAVWYVFFAIVRAGRRWRRHRGRRCEKCAYDLSGLAAARCPECGNVIASAPAAST